MMLFDGCPVRVRLVCAAMALAFATAGCGGGDSGTAQASTLSATDASTSDASGASGSTTALVDTWASDAATTEATSNSDTVASTTAAADVSSSGTSGATTSTTVSTASASTSSSTTVTAAAATSTSTDTSSTGLTALSSPLLGAGADAEFVEDSADQVISTKAAAVTTSSTKAPLVWGNTLRPFSANSPWNSRPVNPVLSSLGIPKSSYFPTIAAGTYSTGVYVASATDTPMVVKGPSDTVGITNVDAGGKQASITIPRWPAGTVPASGSDGHCEIFDPISGVIHSFFKLKNDNGTWRAALYGWTKLNGTGWGSPAHYYQGARATGVVSSAGLIRTHEIDDGDTMYRHALTMSLTYNGLSKSPTYVFPATAADGSAATTNTGEIPEGALVMLPKTFDTSKLSSAKLRKVAETLKTYGAYVVDRNVGTPFVIYVEMDSGFTLYPNGWNNAVAADLDAIRAALRSVASASSWVNAYGSPVTFTTNQNLLSMRGGWRLQSGPQLGTYDTWKQAVVFPANSSRVVQINTTGVGFAKLAWAKPVAGKVYKVTANTTGGAQFRLSFTDCKDASKSVDSGILSNGGSFQFTWPASACWSTVWAYSGVNQASTVGANLVRVN